MRTLATWNYHIDNGGFSIDIIEEDNCIRIVMDHSYCEHSHSSELFCASDIGPDELLDISKIFAKAAEELKNLQSDKTSSH